jgi:hypothetical protein
MSALAGISEDGKVMRVLVTNFSHSQQEIRLKLSHLPWAGPSTYEQSVIDAGHDLSTIHSGQLSRDAEDTIDFDADGPSISLFTIRPAN